MIKLHKKDIPILCVRRFCEFCKKNNGDLVRVRTEDLTVNSRALYQLSYEVDGGSTDSLKVYLER